MSQGEDQPAHYYLAGGGIASLAAAVFLIRDAGVSGEQVTIFEKEDRFGGSLDGAGDAEMGYLVRGGRMFEPNFVCTFDLLNSIPSGLPGGLSAEEDIFALIEGMLARVFKAARGVEIPVPFERVTWRDYTGGIAACHSGWKL